MLGLDPGMVNALTSQYRSGTGRNDANADRKRQAIMGLMADLRSGLDRRNQNIGDQMNRDASAEAAEKARDFDLTKLDLNQQFEADQMKARGTQAAQSDARGMYADMLRDRQRMAGSQALMGAEQQAISERAREAEKAKSAASLAQREQLAALLGGGKPPIPFMPNFIPPTTPQSVLGRAQGMGSNLDPEVLKMGLNAAKDAMPPYRPPVQPPKPPAGPLSPEILRGLLEGRQGVSPEFMAALGRVPGDQASDLVKVMRPKEAPAAQRGPIAPHPSTFQRDAIKMGLDALEAEAQRLTPRYGTISKEDATRLDAKRAALIARMEKLGTPPTEDPVGGAPVGGSDPALSPEQMPGESDEAYTERMEGLDAAWQEMNRPK